LETEAAERLTTIFFHAEALRGVKRAVPNLPVGLIFSALRQTPPSGCFR
jgi:hypothetical protein